MSSCITPSLAGFARGGEAPCRLSRVICREAYRAPLKSSRLNHSRHYRAQNSVSDGKFLLFSNRARVSFKTRLPLEKSPLNQWSIPAKAADRVNLKIKQWKWGQDTLFSLSLSFRIWPRCPASLNHGLFPLPFQTFASWFRKNQLQHVLNGHRQHCSHVRQPADGVLI